MLSKYWHVPILLCATCVGLAGCLPEAISSANAPPSSPVDSNFAPTISGQPSTQAVVGSSWSFQPSVTDSDGDALTFTASGLPGWATINAQTGLVRGTPGQSDTGTTGSIVVRVSDGEASAALPAFQITVVPATGNPGDPPGSSAPTISGTPATSVVAGTSYSFTPIASDADGDMLSFTISAKPSWAAFSTATGALTGTPNSGHTGTYPNIVISVTDGQGTVALPAFAINVTPASTAVGSATLRWVPPTLNIDGSALSVLELSGYRIYHGTSPSALDDTREVQGADATTYTFDALPSGTHYFAVTAMTVSGMESGLSAVGSKMIQ